MPRTRVALLVACVLLTGARVSHSQVPCGAWNPVSIPAGQGIGLTSVSASSASDVWAVGKAVYHWNGIAWTQVPAPGLGSPDSVLRGVAAVSPGLAWMVGYTSFLGTPQTLVERWNGSSWSVVPSPVIAGGSEFDAIAVLSANDAWAVGARAGGLPEFPATRVTLTAHWNGSSWTTVPSPNVSNRSHELLDIAAIAPNDVWAVGSSRNIGEEYRTLILHWNGSSWSVSPSPNLPGLNSLTGVSAFASNDVWAVGSSWDGVISRQVFLHWDGSSWSEVLGPGGATACTGCISDVLAMGPDDVWAVGSTIGHWNGTQWSLVPNPDVPGSIGTGLRSLARIGACDAWAVGGSFDSEGLENALSVRLGSGGGTINQAPVANASATPASGPGPLEVQFSSAGSLDPDGSIVSWLWDFGDSSDPPNRHDPNPVHTFLQTGSLTYQVSLRVTDNHGAMTETSVTVRITPPLHVEEQSVNRIVAGGAMAARNVVTITDRDLLPMAGVAVTAQFSGPSSGIATGTTDQDGRVQLESSPAAQAPVPWCFTVIDVAREGCIYTPGSNVVTEQCESGTLAVGDGRSAPLALRVSPSPAPGPCTIHLALPVAAPVRVTIHDTSGRRVRELGVETLGAGDHSLRWDGADADGRLVGAGVYFVTARIGDRRISTRVLRTR